MQIILQLVKLSILIHYQLINYQFVVSWCQKSFAFNPSTFLNLCLFTWVKEFTSAFFNSFPYFFHVCIYLCHFRPSMETGNGGGQGLVFRCQAYTVSFKVIMAECVLATLDQLPMQEAMAMWACALRRSRKRCSHQLPSCAPINFPVIFPTRGPFFKCLMLC